jgi:8-oxo-dGTP pyrophosphatase MutT (NUDIX family)
MSSGMVKVPALTTCGIVVSDGQKILLGHATRSPRWDIPKGLAKGGETFIDAAIRELNEETGLIVTPDELVDMGVHDYLPTKRIALFGWHRDPLPDPHRLVCRSTVLIKGAYFPEFDRFGIFDWNGALTRVGKNLGRVLRLVGLPSQDSKALEEMP